MIEYQKGDLLAVTEGVIAHGCNCLGVMGSGVALAVKNKYPRAYKEYLGTLRQYKEVDISPLGKCQLVFIEGDLVVANLFTQYSVATYPGEVVVDYQAIRSAFSYLKYYTYEVINIPKIGAGLAGGDWNIIEQIINEEMGERKVICWTLD